MSELDNISYLFGTFCAIVQQVEELALPNMEKRGTNWAEDALLLYRTNPTSTMQLMAELMKKFPEKLYEDDKIYVVDDLIQLYKQLDVEKILGTEIDRHEFIAGYQSKISDFADDSEENPQEIMALLNDEVAELSFLLGLLIAKMQYMEEASEEDLAPRGDQFLEDIIVLLETNVDSYLQIVVSVIGRMPDSCMIGRVFLTSKEMQELFLYLGLERLKSVKVDQENFRKGYRKQVDYFKILE